MTPRRLGMFLYYFDCGGTYPAGSAAPSPKK
jgi:hypothetical protein